MTLARWARAAAGAAIIGIVLGCPDKPVGPAGGTPLRTIVITPDTGTVAVGASRGFTAVALDAAGNTLTGFTFYWSSQTPATATISSSTGMVTGVAVGHAQIAASAQGISGFATVTVTAKPIASVTVYPQSGATLRIATTLQLTDTIKDISGAVVAAQAAWSSDSPSVASVDQNGLVTARALGTATITAAYGGKSGSAPITVSQVPVKTVTITSSPPSIFIGQTTQLSAVAKDSAGNNLNVVIRFHSQNAAVATVDSVTGIATGVSAGSAPIVAASEGVSSSPVAVSVTMAPASTVVLSPSVSQVHVGQVTTLTATVTDATGNPIPNPTVNFSSNNTNIASIQSSSGATAQVLPGPQPGTATITGTDGTATGTATIIVSLVGVDSVHVTAPQDTLTLGQGETLTATAYDSSGNALGPRPITWKSSNTAVATVTSPGGVVTTHGAGTAVMFATISGVTGSLAIVVNQVPVATVIVVPATDTIIPLGQVQLRDTLKDASGNVLTGRVVTWNSGDNTIATVSSTGLVTGVGSGSVQITATSEGVQGSNTTLVLQPVQTVIVAPSTATITTAQTVQFTDTLKDVNNNVVTGRTVVWSSSNPAIHVSNTGLVTPNSPTDTGSATITATVNQPTGSRSGTATVTVTLVPVASVVVYPTPVTIYATAPVNTMQLNDSTKDAGGNNLTGRPVVWAPTSGGVATVNASGLVTATNSSAGSATITATASGGANGSGTIVVLGHSDSVKVVQETPGALSVSGGPNSGAVYATIQDTFGSDVSSTRLLTWTSSDSTSVTITQGGISVIGRQIRAGTAGAVIVTAIANNSSPVTITATTTDPGPVVVTGTTSIIINP